MEKFNSITTKARSICRFATEIEDEASSLKKFILGHLNSARSAMKIENYFFDEIDALCLDDSESTFEDAL
jgi:hypothetical protein